MSHSLGPVCFLRRGKFLKGQVLASEGVSLGRAVVQCALPTTRADRTVRHREVLIADCREDVGHFATSSCQPSIGCCTTSRQCCWDPLIQRHCVNLGFIWQRILPCAGLWFRSVGDNSSCPRTLKGLTSDRTGHVSPLTHGRCWMCL